MTGYLIDADLGSGPLAIATELLQVTFYSVFPTEKA